MTANPAMIEQYRNNFLKEVEANVEEGEWVKMCMQCGVCSGSCPLGTFWDHPPQEIFMMIRDWNCCAASIGYSGGGELPRLTLSARNIALSEEHNPGQDIVATCAACWLSTREAAERLHEDEGLLAEANQALAEAGLKLENETPIKHMAEVLIEDIGFDAIGAKVKKPLEGIKIAGYVGCQTNRPFGIAGESFENPVYLDKLVDTLGGESIPTYEKKVQCCGGALAFSEPEKSQEMVKGIIEAAYDHGADMIVTPCPVCQMNVEVYSKKRPAPAGLFVALTNSRIQPCE
jgi:heterodisulfide reductase subunit B